MEPNSFGRKLGTGMRVAGNIARQRAREAAASPAANTLPQSAANPINKAKQEESRQRSRNLGQGVGAGARQFGRSVFHPFAHAGRVLWLEITGCFFALFVAFFAQNAYHARSQYLNGPGHRTFLLYCFLTLLFAYFSASSFLRARARSRKRAVGP